MTLFFTVGKMVRRRTNSNTTNTMDDESLISAVKNGDLADKKYSFVRIHCNNQKNIQFLLLGHEQIVSLLIQNGANVSQINDGETALHAVAISGIDLLTIFISN